MLIATATTQKTVGVEEKRLEDFWFFGPRGGRRCPWPGSVYIWYVGAFLCCAGLAVPQNPNTSGRRDLNTRSSVPKTDTLPGYATPCGPCARMRAQAIAGVEPATHGLWFRCSNQLNYIAPGSSRTIKIPFFPIECGDINGVGMFHVSSSVCVRVLPFQLF